MPLADQIAVPVKNLLIEIVEPLFAGALHHDAAFFWRLEL